MRTMIGSILVSVLFGFLTVVAAQRTPSCEEWNTKEYFQTATVEDVTACLDAGADVAARTDDGHTPLHQAAQFNESPAVIETLLAVGADSKAKASNDDHTPLHEAAANNANPDVLKALIDAGAALEAQTANGSTPLHAAAWNNGNPAVIQTLLAAGADPKVQTDDGRTLLHLAAQKQRESGCHPGSDRRRGGPRGADG